MELVNQFQRQLLEECRNLRRDTPLSAAVEQAFLETPRHWFIKRYAQLKNQEWHWHEVNPDNLDHHLPTIYRNDALILLKDDAAKVYSSISQPSLVLDMLNLLQLEPGQKVFELGAGSGWNAALMGHIVGSKGHVYSLEIIPAIAQLASKNIQNIGITNVSIIEADGGDAYRDGAPYERAIFTAGGYDLPQAFYEQLKNRALLLVVLKNASGGDNLFLLQKVDEHFESITSAPCGFVPVTGKSHISSLEPIHLEDLPEWTTLKEQEISKVPFWWGGKGPGFLWRTQGIRSFLSITESLFQGFIFEGNTPAQPKELFFGLLDRENHSLVIARDDLLIAYGNLCAQEHLIQKIHQWVNIGMPGAASFKLHIYPIDAPLVTGNNQWIVKRQQSQFLWSLES